MLNWRRDPGYEQRKMQHELRMNDNRIAIERSKERTKLIEKEIEQLRQENARLKTLNASVRRLCFPPESSSIHQTSIEPDSKPSLPS
jgi:predicted NACHT family NTPase